MIVDIANEKFGEILEKANRLNNKELGPIYITAALMAEANASPAEVVVYIEEKYMSAENSCRA